MKENKIKIIIEIIILVIAFTYLFIKETLPEIKKEFNGSGRIIDTNNYKNMFEFKIDEETDFILILNKENKIYHIIFLSKESNVLYNKSIEDNKLKESIEETIKTLISSNYLKNNSSITIIRYNDSYYNEFKNELKKTLSKYKINNNFKEEESSLLSIKTRLNLEGNDNESILRNLDIYSKNYIINNKNTKTNIIENTESLNNDSSRKLCNNIYTKIEKYAYENNIDNLERNNNILIISSLPADKDGKYFATNNSWYYIKDKKVYAYIEIKDNESVYKYCYNGAIDNIKEGEC